VLVVLLLYRLLAFSITDQFSTLFMNQSRLIRFCCALTAVLVSFQSLSQNFPVSDPARPGINPDVNKQSFIYATKDTSSLGLDIYTLNSEDSNHKKPCIIFVFGGAFVTGKRDDSLYYTYFNSLAENHYVVVSISYRLGMRGVQHVSKFNVKPLKHAVDMAIDDIYDATNWVIYRAGEMGIDTSAILLSGSSSGAISVLTAEFERKNGYAASNKLPPGFQYAGIISFSGAILSLNGRLKYKNKPAPKMMFHGTADRIVTYNDIRFLNKGFYGSGSIARVSKENNYPYYLFSEEGMGHEVAVLPMLHNIPEILDFLEKYVRQRKSFQINVLFKDPDQKPVLLLSSSELMKKLNH
jgi:predicted esterase